MPGTLETWPFEVSRCPYNSIKLDQSCHNLRACMQVCAQSRRQHHTARVAKTGSRSDSNPAYHPCPYCESSDAPYQRVRQDMHNFGPSLTASRQGRQRWRDISQAWPSRRRRILRLSYQHHYCAKTKTFWQVQLRYNTMTGAI